MDISSISLPSIDTAYALQNSVSDQKPVSNASGFEALLQSAIDMLNETNAYTNEAAEAELVYAMGLNESTTDLQVAQMKASMALQYTVAIRNSVIEAYKEIMQLQF